MPMSAVWHMQVRKYSDALRMALRMDDRELAEQTLAQCDDIGERLGNVARWCCRGAGVHGSSLLLDMPPASLRYTNESRDMRTLQPLVSLRHSRSATVRSIC